MITIGSTLRKTVLLLTLTTLTIGFGASANIVEPDNGVFPKEDLQVNVTKLGGNDYDLWRTDVDENWVSDGTNVTGNISIESGNLATGKYQVKVNNTNSPDTETFYIDDNKPTINSKTPSDGSFVSSTSPDIELNLDSNGASPMKKIWLEVDGNTKKCTSFTNSNPKTCSFSPNLDNGDQHTVSWNASDQIGNTNSGSWTFTVDTSYDGDESPEISLSDGSDGSVLMDDSNEDQGVTVTLDEQDESSDITVKCYDGSGDLVDGDAKATKDVDSDGTEFSCELDGDEYGGSVVDLYVKMCDQAGNCVESDTTSLTLDAEKPNVVDLSNEKGLSTFNGKFDLSFGVTDDASGVSYVEYTFDSSTPKGEGTEISSFDDGSVTIDPSGLSRGNHTVYVRAQDEAGRWSTVKEFDFEFFPDRNPKVSLSAPESIEVTSGSSKDFTLTIENTGEFFIDAAEFSGSKDMADSFAVTGLKQGESVEKTVTVDASNQDVGVYNLTLSAGKYGASATVQVTVRASESQKSSIDQDIQKWVEKKNSLEKNISEIGTLKASNQNITQFTEKVSKAKQAVENGKYYKAKSYLQNIDSSFSQASSTYSQKLEQHQENRRNLLFLLAFGGFILIGGGIGGFLLYREGEIEDLDEIEFPEEMPEIPEFGVVDKVKNIVSEAESEVEEETGYTFEDFN